MPKRPSTAPVAEQPSSKRAKPTFSSAESAPAPSANAVKSKEGKQPVSTDSQTDDQGDTFWELSSGGTRRATVNEFKGSVMVNLREYYEADGVKKPGKKGISLPVDQFAALIGVLPQIEASLKEKGVQIPRPAYDGASAPGADDGEGEEDGAEVQGAEEAEEQDEEQESEEEAEAEEMMPVPPPKAAAKTKAKAKPVKEETKKAKKNYEATDDEGEEPKPGDGVSKLAKFKYG